MARYRKSNGEHLLEAVVWCFEGSADRALLAAMVFMGVFCFGVPSLLDHPESSVLADIFRSLSTGSVLVGAGLGLALSATALLKWWREAE